MIVVVASLLCVFGIKAGTKKDLKEVADTIAEICLNPDEPKKEEIEKAAKKFRDILIRLMIDFRNDPKKIKNFQKKYTLHEDFVIGFSETYRTKLTNIPSDDEDKKKLLVMSTYVHLEIFELLMPNIANNSDFKDFKTELHNLSHNLNKHPTEPITTFETHFKIDPSKFTKTERFRLGWRAFRNLLRYQQAQIGLAWGPVGWLGYGAAYKYGKEKQYATLTTVAAAVAAAGISMRALRTRKYKGLFNLGSTTLPAKLVRDEVKNLVYEQKEDSPLSLYKAIANLGRKYSTKNIDRILEEFSNPGTVTD